MNSIAWYTYPLAIIAGIVAGIINTLAGSGSLVTLPMLIALGLPSNIANATNRVGVTFQNIVGITTFYRSGKFDMSGTWWLVLPALPGAVLGAWLASTLGKQETDVVIGTVMLLFDAQKWLRQHSEVRPGRPSWITLLFFFGVGVYGAFIQAGVGVFILAAMVLGTGYSLIHANAVKLVLVLIITLVALPIFMSQEMVNWSMGLLMAVGQSIGAWMAARFATQYKDANVWVRRLLIAVIVVSIIRFFGVWDLFVSLLG